MTFFSYRRDGELLGVAALRELDSEHAEIKSMHTAAARRRQGVARALLSHLLAVARARGYRRISLETGSQDAFGAARSLYASEGFSALRGVRRLSGERAQRLHDAPCLTVRRG